MHNAHIPESIRLSRLKSNHSLSPSNYRDLSIRRTQQVPLREFLQPGNLFTKGTEPGATAYVNKSATLFLRNSCISSSILAADERKAIYINPNIQLENELHPEDILLCKDANIGESCIFLAKQEIKTFFSSGLVRLNFINSPHRFAHLAFLRDSYFVEQLDAATPRGATIRHAGDKFLDCKIPLLTKSEEWILPILDSLVKNIAYAELACERKLSSGTAALAEELRIEQSQENATRITEMTNFGRLDAGRYSAIVKGALSSIEQYKGGAKSLEEFGFTLKRGPNLQKRDLGRSIQTDEMRPGYTVLLYPSDISDSGYIERTTFLGASGAIWHLKRGDILFSGEGTVGKLFVSCDESVPFTTNIHGIIISPKTKTQSLQKSILVAFTLALLRERGILDRLSVGGQGGSFAVSYWDLIKVPQVGDALATKLLSLYTTPAKLDALNFDRAKIEEAGIFQLSNLRILCISLLQVIVAGIKAGPDALDEHFSRARKIVSMLHNS